MGKKPDIGYRNAHPETDWKLYDTLVRERLIARFFVASVIIFEVIFIWFMLKKL